MAQKARSQKNIYQYGEPLTPENTAPNQRGYADHKPQEEKPKDPEKSPPADVVLKFHKYAPTDTRPDDIHHTLGASPNQAARGSHTHQGGADGPLLLDSYVLTGSKATPTTMWPSIIACLVRLGATDNTTA